MRVLVGLGLSLALLACKTQPKADAAAPIVDASAPQPDAASPSRAGGDFTPCGNQIDHADPAEFHDVPFAQRACCFGERADPCDKGYAPGIAPVMDPVGTNCDPKMRTTWEAQGTYWKCRCPDGVSYAQATCIRAEPFETRSCKLVGANDNPVAMSLFVAGLNHGRLDGDAYVGRKGMEELRDAILSSTADPSQLVIAITGSMRSYLDHCQPGRSWEPLADTSGGCLTSELERLTGKRFTYTARHDMEEVFKFGGTGVVTGERWRVTQGPEREYRDQNGYAAQVVYLEDTKTGAHLSLYLLHAGGPLLRKIGPFVLHARTMLRPGDLAPIFVGDFNVQYSGAPDHEAWGKEVDWLNRGVRCAAEGHTFALEGEKMHVFAGKPGNTPIGYGFPAGLNSLRPHSLKYSAEPGGRPASLVYGIWLPSVGHNVIGLDLSYASICDPRTRPAPAWGSKDGACLPSCESSGGTCQNGDTCSSDSVSKGDSYDCRSCCAPICDPASQPATQWGVKNGQCLPSCGSLGGDQCDGCGASDKRVGDAYDCGECCKRCVPSCEGRCGGPDGCGNQCPAKCPTGQHCIHATSTCKDDLPINPCTKDCSSERRACFSSGVPRQHCTDNFNACVANCGDGL